MQRDNFPFKAVPQSHWPIASTAHKCVLCGKSFGLFQVADNCHGCGRVCCTSCLSDHLVLPGQPGTAPVPVCPVCAKSITRTHEEAEMAMQRCQLLEEILSEQALQAEKMRSDLREQQEENKLLQHEKERLKATIARMEIEAEVAAAAATASASAAAVSPTAALPTSATSPAVSPANTYDEVSTLEDGIPTEQRLAMMEEKLNKKKRQLDVREATLKDALKKVSADAAKNADQRVALQEQEKQLTTLLTAKFTALFEGERQRLEDICTEAVTDVQNQYVMWVAQQQDSALERKRKFEQAMEERQQRAMAEVAEVRAARDDLQRQVEDQKELIETLQAEARGAAATAAQTTDAAATKQPQQQQHESDRQALQQAAAAAVQRAEAAEKERQQLQAELDAAKALYAEETQAREVAFAAYEAEQRQVQQRLEAFMKSYRVQQADAEAEREAAVAAAVGEAERRADERHAQELTAQRTRLEAKAAADLQQSLESLEQQHKATLESVSAQHAVQRAALEEAAKDALWQLQEATRQGVQQSKGDDAFAVPVATAAELAEREETTADAVATLNTRTAAHEQEKAVWAAREAQLQSQLAEAEGERDRAVKDCEAAVAAASRDVAAALAKLADEHNKEKAALVTKVTQLKLTQTQQDDDHSKQEKMWKEEKVALQKTCKDLEARLEAHKAAAWQLQQQLRDCRQQLTGAQARAQVNLVEESTAVAQSRAATAWQRCAAALVKEVQQAQQRILSEHAAAVAQMRSGLQEAAKGAVTSAVSQKEKKAREAARQLQAQVSALKQEKEAVRQQLQSEQDRRRSAEAKLGHVKAALLATQSTEQQQRQAVADLQERYRAVMDELEAAKMESAAQVVVSAVPPAPLPYAPVAGAAHLFGMVECWMQQRAYLEGLYAMTLTSVLQHEWSAAMVTTLGLLANEAERQRQMRVRNARALENTTSTIKEVQEDLRVRTQTLVERQALLREQERHIAEKKKRMEAVCRDLYAVAQELRKKHLSDDECASAEEVVRSAHIMGEDV
jgi:hypothetical protein